MIPKMVLALACTWMLILPGCATLQSDFEAPSVNIIRIRPLPSEEFTPQFEIDLQIINPNRTPLALEGIAYHLSLEGHKVMSGVAKDLPTIDGYSEGEVTVVATASLVNGIRLVTDLIQHRQKSIAYELDAKLDLGGLQPTIRVEEKGNIDLADPSP